jgi:hypothetical protein
MFKSENNKYLGIDGLPHDGAMIVGVDEPVGFDIWPDENTSGAFKCVFAPRVTAFDPADAARPGSTYQARTTASTSPTMVIPRMARSSRSGPIGRAQTRPGSSTRSSAIAHGR